MKVFKVAKTNAAVTSTNPNDFVINSSYNSPKVVKQGTISQALPTTGGESFLNLAHGLNYTPLTLGFCKFNNNEVGIVGNKHAGADFFFTNLRVNATNVRFGYRNSTGGSYTPTFRYLATEIPLAGTPSVADPGGKRIVIAKEGFNATTELNPNNKIYDSQFNTFKYFSQGIATITIPAGTPDANVTVTYEQTLSTHNLGYYPLHNGNEEYSEDDPGKVYVMPLMFSDAGFWTYDMLYVGTSSLIFRREYGNSYGSIDYLPQTIKVYWKIYSYDLGF